MNGINARGAIARFERNAIEIRLVDVQECPMADIAIVKAISGAIQYLMKRAGSDVSKGYAISSPRLRDILQRTIGTAENAMITEADYLQCLGLDGKPLSAREVWRHLAANMPNFAGPERAAFDQILAHGTLATRMKKITLRPDRDGLVSMCRALSGCLAEGKMLLP